MSNLLMLPYLFVRYRTGTIRIDRVAGQIDALADLTREQLTSVAERCFEEDVRNDIMAGAVQLIENHRDAGDTVVLATSSLALIVRPLARELGIEHVVCTKLEFRDGVATGRFVRPPCFGDEKLRCVNRFVESRGGSMENVTFYSDSRADLPLLRAVGTAIAVNPDPGLKRIARREGWSILQIS